jgi:exosortase H (IPTLxxWG-CTERM-specific)
MPATAVAPCSTRAGLHPITTFTLKFLLICVALFTLLEISPDALYYPLNRANTILAVALLKGLGLAPHSDGIVIVLEGFRAQVIGECSAVFAFVLPVAFMIAFPVSWPEKLLGIPVGLALIFLLNVLRIGLLVVVGARSPHLFDGMHQYGGQTAMMLMIVLVCFGWIQWSRIGRRGERIGPGLLRCVLLSAGGLTGWYLVGEPYTRLQYHLSAQVLSWFDVAVRLPGALRLYPDTFLCFNYVTLTVLMGTFDVRSPLARLTRNWLAAMAVLTVGHFVFRIVQLLCLSSTPTAPLFWTVNALLIFNEWLLPFGLFLWSAREAIGVARPTRGGTRGERYQKR